MKSTPTIQRKTCFALAIGTTFLPLISSLSITFLPLIVHAEETSATMETVTVSDSSLGSITEQTHSYTTGKMEAATKMELTPRETPQTVSIVTRTKMDDFNMNSLNDVLESTTGVNVEQIETDRTYYTARGFDITNFQTDGIGQFNQSATDGDLDTAIYDSIEVVKGANGLMSGVGNPSATINRVRKRPTSELGISTEISTGSWNDNRLDVDVSGSISKSVRGRFVTAYEDKDSYINEYSRQKDIAYGVIETDINAVTLLTFGTSLQHTKAQSPMWGALALFYTDGTATDYDVSSNTSADWSYWDTTKSSTFLEFMHTFANEWSVKAIYTHDEDKEKSALFYVYGTPDPITNEGLTGWAGEHKTNVKTDLIDVYVNGDYDLFGRNHDLVFGFSSAQGQLKGTSLYDYTTPYGFPAIGDFTEWDGNTPKPTFADAKQFGDFKDTQSAVYAATHFHMTNALALIVGTRVINWESKGENYGVDTDVSNKSKIIPYGGVVYDLNKHLSVYSSYTETFQPQSELDTNLKRLDPASGNSTEIGVKGNFYEGLMNATAAVFNAKHDNVAEYFGTDSTTGKYVYTGHDYKSQGVELEVAGKLAEGLEATMGYSYTDINDSNGKAARTFTPEHMLKAATQYRLPIQPVVNVGAKVNFQNSIERDFTYSDFATPPTVVNGTTKQDAYILLDIFTNIEITKQLKTSLNINNVTNEKYLNSIYWDQGFYGTPRSASVSLHWEY